MDFTNAVLKSSSGIRLRAFLSNDEFSLRYSAQLPVPFLLKYPSQVSPTMSVSRFQVQDFFLEKVLAEILIVIMILFLKDTDSIKGSMRSTLHRNL